MSPPPEAREIKHSGNLECYVDHYICHGEREKACRKIYENVEYSAFEKQKVRELKEEIRNQNI